MQDFSGKVAVVTGSASGIGRGLAERLLEAGASVVLADVNEEPLTQTARELASLGNVTPIVVDVSDSASVVRLAQRAQEVYGKVDLLCNNAGVGGYLRFSTISLATWRWMINVNLMGVVYGIHTFLPLLAERSEAHIINTASISGVVHGKHLAPYVASKAGVVGLTETLAKEFADEFPGIGLSVVLPGPVNTNISRSDEVAPADVPRFERIDPELRALRQQRAENKTKSMSPRDAADIILQGVREKRLHIFTDRIHRPRFEERAQTILASW